MKADKKEITRLLNTAKGQMDGISRMIEGNAYCIDVSNQILATIALLKKVNHEILEAHLHSCVINAETKEEKEVKLTEISEVIKKLLK